MAETNMEQSRPSRKAAHPGDVFRIRYPTVGYLFGRVIMVDLADAPMPGAHLIYVYDHISRGGDVDDAILIRDRLLIPPRFINRLPWSRGYFQLLYSRSLREADILESHCFEDTVFKVCRDVDGAVIDKGGDQCGIWGLDSYRTLDDSLSEALGLARVPDEL